jgi:muramidase (phage lysozyme)
MPKKNSKSNSKKTRRGGTLPKVLKTIEEYEKLYENSNIQAFLITIRKGEGTLGPRGFYRHYGRGYLSTLDQQPKEGVKWQWGKNDDPSSAVGAFMFLNSKDHPNWPNIAKIFGFTNFIEINQITGAEYFIDQDKALQYVLDGDIVTAITKTNGTWTSLPSGSQQRLTMQEALEFYQLNGGTLNETNINYIPILNWKSRSAHPSDPVKQYPDIPEYIKILMGKQPETLIHANIRSLPSKTKPSAATSVAGKPIIAALEISEVLTERKGTLNNNTSGVYGLINSSNSLYNNYRLLPGIAMEASADLYSSIANIPFEFPDRNGGTNFSNSSFPGLLAVQDAGAGMPANIKKRNKNLADHTRQNDDILKLNNVYDFHATPALRLPAKKAANPLNGKSKKWPSRAITQSTQSGTPVIINLNKPLIENFTIKTGNVKDGLSDFKHKVEEVLLEILNSANVIQ